MVKRDAIHRVIIPWCPFDDGGRLRLTCAQTRAVDPGRPVVDASGYFHGPTDVFDVHLYCQHAAIVRQQRTNIAPGRAYQHHPGLEESYEGQPYVVSEYGGISWQQGTQVNPGGWGHGNSPRTQEEYGPRMRDLTKVLVAHPKIAGFCYTQLYDVEQETNGLLTFDRRPKVDSRVWRSVFEAQSPSETG